MTENEKKPIDLPDLPPISNEKPTLCSKIKIAHAIKNNGGKATLEEIKEFIAKQFPYFKEFDKKFGKIISTTLFSYRVFVKKWEIRNGKSINTWRIDSEKWENDEIRGKNRKSKWKQD